MHRFKNSLTALAGLSLIGVIALVIAGCSGKQENSNSASSSLSSNQVVAGNAAKPGPGAATPATKGRGDDGWAAYRVRLSRYHL